MQLYADRTPGSRYEEKELSLAWHYRGSDPDLAAVRVAELKDALISMIANHNLTVFDGNRVLEVKSSLVGKAQAAAHWYAHDEYDFILAVGDDPTDEELFAAAPESAWSVRVGLGPTNAHYFIESPAQLRTMLEELA